MSGTEVFLKESQKPIEKLNLIELLEAQERQSKIVSNKKFLQKLPDKGKKLLDAYEKIEAQIRKIREEEAQLADMFASMQLSQPKIDIDKMEWTGKIAVCGAKKEQSNKSADHEENERDIVNILTTTNETSKIIIDERNRTPSPSSHLLAQDKFYRKITEKADHTNPSDTKFKPFRTLKHEKPITKEHLEKWDNTAATPPVLKHTSGVVPIHLEESLEKQVKTEEKLKELELERAKSKFFTSVGSSKKSAIIPDQSEIHPDEEYEVYDEETQDEGGRYIVITSNDDLINHNADT